MAKLIRILFVVLLLVTIGEAGYYLYINQNYSRNKISSQVVSEVQNLPTSVVIPTNTPYPVNPAVSRTLQNITAFIDRKVITSAVVNSEYKGYVSEISQTNGAVSDIPNSKYVAKIFIKSALSDTKPSVGFYFSSQEFSQLQVKVASGGQEAPDVFESLKVGDLVIIREPFDLVKMQTGVYQIVRQ